MYNYTFADYEDNELDYENLSPLFGMPDTTWNEPTFYVTFTVDCTCLDEECNYCNRNQNK